jgi:hypothetical protein
MKRAFLLLTLWCSPAFAQGFEVSNPDERPQGDSEFDEQSPVQEAAAANGPATWQPMPPPPPTDEEVAENPLINEESQPPAQAPTQQQFEQELSPYGKWIDTPQGRVWQPDAGEVGEDFTPYSTGGTWGYNDSGWYFNTGWSWGWAPFHYGRWWRHASYGWVWYPGYTWGSSWVDWRCARGYVGWAPLGPPWASVQFGLGVPGWSFVSRSHLWHPYVAYHQIVPRYSGGRYAWYHSPAFHTQPAWHQASRSWRQPAWHAAAPWHGGGHTYGSVRTSNTYRSYRSGAPSHISGGFHSSGGSFHGGGGHRH